MSDVSQSQTGGSSAFAASLARVERTIAFADWANDVPPPAEPGTSAMTINDVLGKVVGELARIAACYDLKEAQENFQDAAVLDGSTDTDQYEQGQENLKNAMGRLNCPGRT
jgi:hypothetical protein